MKHLINRSTIGTTSPNWSIILGTIKNLLLSANSLLKTFTMSFIRLCNFWTRWFSVSTIEKNLRRLAIAVTKNLRILATVATTKPRSFRKAKTKKCRILAIRTATKPRSLACAAETDSWTIFLAELNHFETLLSKFLQNIFSPLWRLNLNLVESCEKNICNEPFFLYGCVVHRNCVCDRQDSLR